MWNFRFPWRVEIKKAPKPISLGDVVEMSRECQLRMDAIEGSIEELKKKLNATQRKVYRDVDKTNEFVDLINSSEPDNQLIPGNHAQPQMQLRTGDVPPDNWR